MQRIVSSPRRARVCNSSCDLKELQADTQALLSRVGKEATRLSHEQKLALDRVVTDAKQLRSDLEKLVKQTTTELESRAKRFLSTLEKDAKNLWRSK